jgi:hypothetical protein
MSEFSIVDRTIDGDIWLQDAFGRWWPEENFYCGKGWEDLIHKLVLDLIALGWDKQVMQSKEKFGGLRFYIGGATDAVHNRVAQAEEESFTICQQCGQPGRERNTGWILTLCDEHAKGLEKEE